MREEIEMEKKLKPIQWIYHHSKKYLWAVVLLSLISAAIAGSFVILALLSSLILDTATGTRNGNIAICSILLLGFIGLQAILNVISSNVRVRVSGKIEMAMKREVFLSVLKKSYLDISQIHSGEILNRFTSDIDLIVGGIVGIIPQVISIGTKLLAGMLVLFHIDYKFTLVILTVGVTICFGSRLYSEKFRHLHKEVQETNGKVRSFLQECIENLIVIKSFDNEEIIQGKLQDYQMENYRIRIKRNTISNLANTVVYVIFSSGYYAALAWGAFQIAKGTLTIGALTAFLQIINQVKAPFRNMSGLIPRYYSMLASAERLMELEEFADEDRQHLQLNPKEAYQNMKEIVFDNVTFSYDKANILEKFSVRIPKGSMAAVVGPSGRGKSTMMKLLLSLLRCKEGEIYFAMEEGKLPVDAGTRNMFSYVPQGNMILSGTIRENIAFSRQEVSDEKIIQAAKVACIWEMIEMLPKGLDTELKERGTGLSEGQIQRIAIARALLSDAPILLLDECTSALDEETESRLLKNLRELKTKTIICISHRMAALEGCKIVIRL